TGVRTGHDSRLKIDELEWVAATVTDDGQRHKRALLDCVADVSGAGSLDRFRTTKNLDRLTQTSDFESDIHGQRLIDVCGDADRDCFLKPLLLHRNRILA